MPDDGSRAVLRDATAGGPSVEHVDVLIVGAGLSGICAACHFETGRRKRRYAILEARAATGGTWDLFRYPGVRSDSDMHTLGFRFRPWRDPRMLAPARDILAYLRETAAAYGVDRHVRLGHRVTHAAWSSVECRWTVRVARAQGGSFEMTCNFLMMTTGYYRTEAAYTPAFEGIETFGGQVVHPQFWPEDLELSGRRVVVIGSGATAVSLVPAIAARGAQVTMLQRSPSYVLAIPSRDGMAEWLRRRLPERAALRVIRVRNILISRFLYRYARRHPQAARARILSAARRRLGGSEAAVRQFSPDYQVWDQRVCFAPDGDLFRAIREGRASIETGRIRRFTPTGIELEDERHLEADLVVTATGLELSLLGEVAFSVDGASIRPSEQMSYKGLMLTGLPNLANVVGYTNASWTLKADLICTYVERLLDHMERRGHRSVVAERDPTQREGPFLELSSGYIRRAEGILPTQGDRAPWRLHQDYLRDLMTLRFGRIDDGVLRFGPV